MEAWQLSTLTYAPFRRQLRAPRRPVFDLKSSDRRRPTVWARFLREALGRGQHWEVTNEWTQRTGISLSGSDAPRVGARPHRQARFPDTQLAHRPWLGRRRSRGEVRRYA